MTPISKEQEYELRIRELRVKNDATRVRINALSKYVKELAARIDKLEGALTDA